MGNQVMDLKDGTVVLGADGPEVIKFMLRMSNPRSVPAGIPKRERELDHKVDTAHAKAAIDASMTWKTQLGL